ncbi:MAG: thiamine pyrophosphate-binding protein [Clostridium sp.]|nr:thiamine pyrophosphate-binding protein [Clostridium sp.]
MKVKVSNYIADFLVEHGVAHMFTVTGGGAMHLNDAFGHKQGLECIYNHHEQACAIAAEGYARLTGKIAGVCVTSGPGGTNAITGVLGGWLDSIPMFVISGQVKRETTIWSTDVPLRQLGDQEFNIIDCIAPMTKYCKMITDPTEIKYHLEKAWYMCQHGRGGPVWLDIPLDVQAAIVETDELVGFCERELEVIEEPIYDVSYTEQILNQITRSKRPVVFAGTGIRLSGAYNEFLELVEKLGIPVVTAWNAHDVLWDDSPYFCGRPGTIGTRGGNFVVENSDLLLVLGCRLNIRQISYNYKDFAKKAYKIVVDIDEAELRKPTISPDMAIHANVADVMHSLNQCEYTKQKKHEEWLTWCRNINRKYPIVLDDYLKNDEPMNPYAFMDKMFKCFEADENVICSNGSACVISFQTAYLQKGQRLFANSGCAAMGYGLPAAIGCAVARRGKRVVCLEGDGSLQMNIQELQTVFYNKLNLKLIVLNNNGYHSIRQTQTNLFNPPMVGVCDGNGLSFPDMKKIAYAYDIPFVRIERLSDVNGKIQEVLSTDGPVICEAILDPEQFFAPKLSSKVLPDGKIVSPPIDDMFPFLDREEYESNKLQ